MTLNHFYRILIEPRSTDLNAQNRELVLNWLLVSTLLLGVVAFLNALVITALSQVDFLEDRFVAIAAFLMLFAGLLLLSRFTRQHRLPSVILLLLLFSAAFGVVYRWGLINPVGGILLFSLVIVMAGILLGARYALLFALLTTVGLVSLELAKTHYNLMPVVTWERQPSNLADVVSISSIFAVLALVSWLFNRQMERALKRAELSEQAIKRQRDLLEIKVAERTRALQAAQLEQMQEVYRFAELGHLSTALFHDLANHIMSVSLDIQGLRKRRQSALLQRIETDVRYINDVVRHVQQQIRGTAGNEQFDVICEIHGIIDMLTYPSRQRGVSIELKTTAPTVKYRADLTRFRQIILNLLSNAIEAYPIRTAKPAMVTIEVAAEASLLISVTDHGKGIAPAIRKKIFEPFYTTKSSGMGIGLFIVRKVVTKDLAGELAVTSSPKRGTCFSVLLPYGTVNR